MKCFLIVFSLVFISAMSTQAQIVPERSTWDYLMTLAQDENGDYVATDPLTNSSGVDFSGWTELDFDTSLPLTTEGRTIHWQTGPGLFGTGDFGVEYGTKFENAVPGQRDATHYFRHEFTTDTELSNLVIRAFVDDGAVFYLDGIPVSTMGCCKDWINRDFDPVEAPHEDISYRDRATVSNGPCRAESVANYNEIDLTLSAGRHVLSASVHSVSANSADLRFDARLDSAESNEFIGGAATGVGQPSAWGMGYGEMQGIQCELPAPAWESGFAPKGSSAIARMLSKPASPSTVSIKTKTVVGGFIFDNEHKYTLTGPGQFELSATGASLIDVLSGSHEIQADMSLQNPLEVAVRPGARLEIESNVYQNDHDVVIEGGGVVAINGEFDTGLTVEADTTLTGEGRIQGHLDNFGGTISPGNGIGTLRVSSFQSFDDSVMRIEIGELANDLLVVDGRFGWQGRLEVELVDGFMPTAGDEFTLVEFGSRSIDYSELDLPLLAAGLSWDVLPLNEGKIRVVPEPDAGGAFCVLLVLVGLSRLGH